MRQKNIFTLLKQDHREVEELLSKIEKTTESAGKTRTKLYAKVRDAITRHSQAEEKVIYPRLQEIEDAKEIGFEAGEEHNVVKGLLTRLDSLSVDDDRWSAALSVLKEVIGHHVEEEESKLFAKMRKHLKAEELKEIATEFVSAKEGLFAPLKKMLAA